MSKKLYQFELDWGRTGCIDGLFIAEEKDVKNLIGKNVYFGEAMGKHSDVEDVMTEDMFTKIDLPDDVIDILGNRLGYTLSGYNPVEIASEEIE